MVDNRICSVALSVMVLAGVAVSQDMIVVKGRLFDNETQKPIAGANVVVRGEKKGTTTDSSGYLRVELAIGQRHILAFSHVAYRKEIRELSPATSKEIEFRIYLTSAPIVLEEVVVHGKQDFFITKAAEKRALYQLGGDEFEKLGEEDMEKAMTYFLPDVVHRLEKRMASDADDFTLYVNGDWKETITLSDIDPFSIRRVLVWEALGLKQGVNTMGVSTGYERDIDVFPAGMPLRRGKFVVSVETK